MSASDKFGLVNKWAIVSLIGNLLTMFGSIFYIMSGVFLLTTVNMFLSCGCFCTWVSFTRYYENT